MTGSFLACGREERGERFCRTAQAHDRDEVAPNPIIPLDQWDNVKLLFEFVMLQSNISG
jgi:hypothetical protein